MPVLRLRLAQLSAHLVVALITLVVIGGATRVMEAGLACPDWPLCFGSLLPASHMGLQVFLEWLHRLDAFLVGLAVLGQFVFSFFVRSKLPFWLPWVYGFLLGLVILQGALGALTVLQLLPSLVVTAHLALALTLVGSMSALSEILVNPNGFSTPSWWKWMSASSLFAVVVQCLLGARMATSWSAQRCLVNGEACELVYLHRGSGIIVASCIVLFITTSIFVGGWPRAQWPSLLIVFILISTQIFLGFLSLHFHLEKPILTITHQLLAALLVAFLSALTFKRSSDLPVSSTLQFTRQSLMEGSHG